jgi:LysM repeat protein
LILYCSINYLHPMKKDLRERCRQWAWIAVSVPALASCSTYQPLDGGSQVPWASRQVSRAVAASHTPVVSEALPARPRPNVARVEPAAPPLSVTAVSTSDPAPVVAPKVAPKPAPVVAATPPAASQGGQHRVAKGERLGAIAGRYGVSLEAMAKTNSLAPPYVIYVGQVLQVPGGGGDVEQRQYVVRRGDTLSAVARRFDVAQADIAAANGIKSPYTLSIGRALEIPGVQTARAVPDAAPPPLTGGGFLWPVSGKVIGGFGVAGNGQRRNGINIAARKGTPVVASEDGVVVYASDGIDG